jgi:hypothetical protein
MRLIPKNEFMSRAYHGRMAEISPYISFGCRPNHAMMMRLIQVPWQSSTATALWYWREHCRRLAGFLAPIHMYQHM